MPHLPSQQLPTGDVIRILQVEDNAADAELVARQLSDDGLSIICRVVIDELTLRRALQDFAPHIVLSDFSLPSFDGLSALRIAREECPATPFIFVSGTIGEERAIEALKRGAVDYVLKDNLRRLVPAIKSALRQFDETKARHLAEDMLRRSESRLQDIINTSRDWIWECDREGRFTFSSPSIREILGYSHHDVLGRRAADYVDPADELQMQSTFSELPSDEEAGKAITLRWRHKTGKVRWLERKMMALRDDDGTLLGVRGIDRDVTQRVAQEVRIRRLNRALRFLSGASSAVMRLRDRQQLLKESCRLAVRVGGYARATLYLLPTGGPDAQPVVCSYQAGPEDGSERSLYGPTSQDVTPMNRALATGQPIVVSDLNDPAAPGIRAADRKALLDLGVRAYIALPLIIDGTAIGVAELHSDEAGGFGEAELTLLTQVAANIAFALQYLHNQESVAYLEYFDPLTAIANRSLFVQRLASTLEAVEQDQGRLSLLVFDICEMSTVNDGIGHHAGDLLLQLVAERMKNLFRDTNAMCRLGGDRFAVLSVDRSADAGTALTQQVGCLFDAPFAIDDHELRISIKAGLAEYPDDGRDADSLLQHAQTALGQAKDAGKQYLRHMPTMNAKASERLTLTNDLRRAVAEQRFTLHYQPKIQLLSGAVDGVEALLRWPDQQPPVSPSVFVPMLESLGLIDEVGDWLLAQALTDSAAWFATSDSFRVAVNISPLQLNREDFAERVLESIGRSPAAARRIELEVTESTLMSDPRRASSSLERLREAGMTVAIDDFGTGHSSLRVLAGLPVDVLKIDRGFIHDIATNRSHRVIVQTAITLAHSLGLRTVAEGVEEQEQVALLRDWGCDVMQGYLICRPAAPAHIAMWLAAGGRGAATPGGGPVPPQQARQGHSG